MMRTADFPVGLGVTGGGLQHRLLVWNCPTKSRLMITFAEARRIVWAAGANTVAGIFAAAVVRSAQIRREWRLWPQANQDRTPDDGQLDEAGPKQPPYSTASPRPQKPTASSTSPRGPR
jgi:hypothetical protein